MAKKSPAIAQQIFAIGVAETAVSHKAKITAKPQEIAANAEYRNRPTALTISSEVIVRYDHSRADRSAAKTIVTTKRYKKFPAFLNNIIREKINEKTRNASA